MILKIKYYRFHSRFPDLKKPKGFNEKIVYRMLYHRNELLSLCADKIVVRQYVEEKVSESILIPMITSCSDFSEIDPDTLPEQFVVKANHGSGWIRIVRDKNDVDWNELKRICNGWLKHNFYLRTREWVYDSIAPKLVFEELILDSKGNIPKDYKFHCFKKSDESDVEIIIQVDVDRFKKTQARNFYDTNWKKLGFSLLYPTHNGRLSPPPLLNKMVSIAKKLSEDFSYVRVDLYCVNNKIYFGELTFYHGAGLERFDPEFWDRQLGDMLMVR